MDQAIVHYIRLRHGLIIGEKTAEEVKIKIGSAYQKVKKQELRIKNHEENDPEIKNKESHNSELMIHDSPSERVALVRGREPMVLI